MKDVNNKRRCPYNIHHVNHACMTNCFIQDKFEESTFMPKDMKVYKLILESILSPCNSI